MLEAAADRPALERLRDNPDTIIWQAVSEAEPVQPEILAACEHYCAGFDTVGVETGRLEGLLKLAFYLHHLIAERDIATKRDDALRRALSTPPKPHDSGRKPMSQAQKKEKPAK